MLRRASISPTSAAGVSWAIQGWRERSVTPSSERRRIVGTEAKRGSTVEHRIRIEYRTS